MFQSFAAANRNVRSFFISIKKRTLDFPLSSHLFDFSVSAGRADASPLRSAERARAGGRNPAGQRSAFPVQDQGIYWSKHLVTKAVVYFD